VTLVQHPANPILAPVPAHPWESRNVYNCGVINHDGKIVLIYRAQGTDHTISRLDYAESTDGVHFRRLPEPAFVPKTPDEIKGVDHGFSDVGPSRHRHSQSGQKDAAIFPGKVNGRYVVFHRIPPSIWIAHSDDLDTWGDEREIMKPRPDSFDDWKLGAGGRRSRPSSAGS
jgi:predicted GH43/DUF377 family glycosyl hydrolase